MLEEAFSCVLGSGTSLWQTLNVFCIWQCIPFRSNRRAKAFVRGTKLLLALGKCLLQKESNHNLINKSIDVAHTWWQGDDVNRVFLRFFIPCELAINITDVPCETNPVRIGLKRCCDLFIYLFGPYLWILSSFASVPKALIKSLWCTPPFCNLWLMMFDLKLFVSVSRIFGHLNCM